MSERTYHRRASDAPKPAWESTSAWLAALIPILGMVAKSAPEPYAGWAQTALLVLAALGIVRARNTPGKITFRIPERRTAREGEE